MTGADARQGPPWNVLFLCTGNSARSIIAESLLRHWGRDRFRAWSAGSEPRGEVQPLAIELLAADGLPTDGLRSKALDELLAGDAVPLDLVITVCDSAAEQCPVFPGRPVTAHWSTPDPAAVDGDRATRMRAYRSAQAELQRRIQLLVSLPLEGLDRMAQQERVRALGAEREGERAR